MVQSYLYTFGRCRPHGVYIRNPGSQPHHASSARGATAGVLKQCSLTCAYSTISRLLLRLFFLHNPAGCCSFARASIILCRDIIVSSKRRARFVFFFSSSARSRLSDADAAGGGGRGGTGGGGGTDEAKAVVPGYSVEKGPGARHDRGEQIKPVQTVERLDCVCRSV